MSLAETDREEGVPVADHDSGQAARARLEDRAETERQIGEVAATLQEALQQGDLDIFYTRLRATDLALAPVLLQDDPARLFSLCLHLIHELGGLSPAVALAVEQHFYMLGAIATMPLAGPNLRLREPRQALLEAVRQGRLLVSNTNSHVHGDQVGSFGAEARREGDGYRVNGSSTFMSMATQGDLILFVTHIGGKERVAFFTELKGNPAIQIGPYTFPNTMLDSDTRRVTFLDTPLTRANVLASSAETDMVGLFTYSLIWHQSMLGALYLGAARQALEEARRFCASTRSREGTVLAELDGVIADLGELALDFRAAWTLVRQMERSVPQIVAAPQLLEEAYDLATAAKYHGTACAERILAKVRHIIGARIFAGGHPMERLLQEAPFGSLSLDFNAVIERRHGRRMLQGRLTGGFD